MPTKWPAHIKAPLETFFIRYGVLVNTHRVALAGMATVGFQATVWRDYVDGSILLDEMLAREIAETPLGHIDTIDRLAKTERQSGFAHLCGQSAVALWALVETVVNDLVAGWVLERPEDLDAKRLAELTLASPQCNDFEEALLFVAEVGRKLAHERALAFGMRRCRGLLALVGVAIDEDDTCRELLAELVAGRNLLVHHSGRIDRRFLNVCTWHQGRWNVGDRWSVKPGRFDRYASAAFIYVERIVQACQRRLGAGDFEFPYF